MKKLLSILLLCGLVSSVFAQEPIKNQGQDKPLTPEQVEVLRQRAKDDVRAYALRATPKAQKFLPQDLTLSEYKDVLLFVMIVQTSPNPNAGKQFARMAEKRFGIAESDFAALCLEKHEDLWHIDEAAMKVPYDPNAKVIKAGKKAPAEPKQ